MDDFQELEPQPLPRWVTIPFGLLLVPITLICIIGSASLLIAPNVPPSLLTVSLGSLFLAGSIWAFQLALRLVFTSPKGRRKLIPPIGLRAIALVFAAIPIVALITGTFWEKPMLHSIMTIAYIGIVIRLLAMAKSRAQDGQ